MKCLAIHHFRDWKDTLKVSFQDEGEKVYLNRYSKDFYGELCRLNKLGFVVMKIKAQGNRIYTLTCERHPISKKGGDYTCQCNKGKE